MGSEMCIRDRNTIRTLVSTTQLEAPIKINLAPNPARDFSTLSFELLEAENLELKVYDLIGNLQETVLTETPYSAGQHRINIDTENYSAGVYFITVETGKGQLATVKMVRL